MTDSLNATVRTRANVYFDGKCVSHSLELADGSKKALKRRMETLGLNDVHYRKLNLRTVAIHVGTNA